MQATAGGGRQDEQAAAWLVFCANVDEWRRVVPGLVVAKGGKVRRPHMAASHIQRAQWQILIQHTSGLLCSSDLEEMSAGLSGQLQPGVAGQRCVAHALDETCSAVG